MQSPSCTVFIVDDDELVRNSLARLVGSTGWIASPCSSAEEFLDKAVEVDTGHMGFALYRPALSQVVREIRHFLTEVEGVPPKMGTLPAVPR